MPHSTDSAVLVPPVGVLLQVKKKKKSLHTSAKCMQFLPRWKGDYNTTQHTTGGQVGPSDGRSVGWLGAWCDDGSGGGDGGGTLLLLLLLY